VRIRLLSFLLIALMAFPAGWAVPVSFGSHSSHATSEAAPDCATHEQHTGRDDCPCCPHQGGSMADCLSVCAAAVAVPVTALPAMESVAGVRPPLHTAAAFTSRADSPFKPPPIL